MSIRSSKWRTYDQFSATALKRSNSSNSTSSTLARAAPVLSKMTRSRTSTTDLSIALATLDWSKAKALAKGVPGQAAQWSKRQGFFEGVKPSHCLPIHEACVTNAPTATVAAILQAYPDGVRCKESSYNRLPLHCACRRGGADAAVVRILIAANKSACLVPDSMGRLPLHYALSNGADSSVIHALLSVHPKAAMGVDSLGWTPLHVACATGSPVGVVAALLHAYTDASIMRTAEKGSTPRRCLGKSVKDRKEILRLLLEAEHHFDRKFVAPQRPILLMENHGVVLV